MARRDLEDGLWKLAVFHAEQSLQLCLKHKLYSRLGDLPKTYDLKTLASALSKFERVDVDSLFLG